MVQIFDWCGGLHETKKNFHPLIHGVAQKRIEWAHKSSIKVIKLLAFILYGDTFSITICFAVLGLWLPESIHPKYEPPLPFYLPFEEQNTLRSFVITTLCQTKCTFDLATFYLIVLGSFYVISINIFAYLNVISDSIKMLDEFVQLELSKSSKEIPLLTIKEWIQIVTDLTCVALENISKLNNIFTGWFLMFEIVSFGSFFIFGLTMVGVIDQYSFIVDMSAAGMILFSFCYINEKFLEKMSENSNALYSIPWYMLNANEQKIFFLASNVKNIRTGLKTGGLDRLSFNRFVQILKAAYSNTVIFKDILQK